MALHKDRRRVDKDHLALAVRKDFNAAGVSEQEVETSFMYSVHNQSMCDSRSLVYTLAILYLLNVLDKNFRMRFAPSRLR